MADTVSGAAAEAGPPPPARDILAEARAVLEGLVGGGGAYVSPAARAGIVPGMGLGLVAAAGIAAGDRVVEVPAAAHLRGDAALAGAVPDAWNRLALRLLRERGSSRYVRMLFRDEIHPRLPCGWRARLRDELRGTEAERTLDLVVGDIGRAWRDRVRAHAPAGAPLSAFVHAYELVLSRAFGADGGATEPVLVPGVCFLNTSPVPGGCNAELAYAAGGAAVVRATRDIAAGEQVLLVYEAGGLSPADSLVRYGFVGESDEPSGRPASVSMSKYDVYDSCECSLDKDESWGDEPLERVAALPFEFVTISRGDPMPPAGLEAVVAAAVPDGDRASRAAGAEAALSARNGQYRTPGVGKDEELAAELAAEQEWEEEDGGADAWEARARRDAVAVRISERRILAEAIGHYSGLDGSERAAKRARLRH